MTDEWKFSLLFESKIDCKPTWVIFHKECGILNTNEGYYFVWVSLHDKEFEETLILPTKDRNEELINAVFLPTIKAFLISKGNSSYYVD